jgi:AraC-like DNA-binding protein
MEIGYDRTIMTTTGTTPLGPPPTRVSVAMVRTISLGLARLGVSSSDFLDALGVAPDAREGGVPETLVGRVVADLATRKGISHLGLDLARSIPLGWFGTLDYQYSTSATLGDALFNVNPNVYKFVEGIEQKLAIEGDSARIVLRQVIPRPEAMPGLAIMRDFSVAINVRRVRDVLGDEAVKITSVRLGYAAPPSIEPYESFFRAPVSFLSGATDEIAFPRDLLIAPLLTADPALARTLSARRTNDRRAGTPEDPFIERVRALVAESLVHGDSALGADVIASQLDLSARSLQRRLKERGMSLSMLIDETRRALAEALLKREAVLLCDVAYRLGFADVKAFFRAFRRWTGTSPRAFQKAGNMPA